MQCEVCGAQIEKSGSLAGVFCPSETDRRGFAIGSRCFETSFWEEKRRWMEAGDVTEEGGVCARIAGVHYVLQPAKEVRSGTSDRRRLGFGGREQTVRFTVGPHAGRILSTNDCWCQGAIPIRFLEQLCDNAQWARPTPERNASCVKESP